MIFGEFPLDDAQGAILAHAVPGANGLLRKGHVLTGADLAHLAALGVTRVMAARLEPGDIGEDDAALHLARALAGPGIRVEAVGTGRANLMAEAAGLFTADAPGIHRLNAADPGITLATLPAFATVEAGRMLATVKIIPFAVPGTVLDAALSGMAKGAPLLALHPFRTKRVAVVSTLLPHLKPAVVDKTRATMAARLQPKGSEIGADLRVPHDIAALADALATARAGADLIVIFGASAIVDIGDVVPAALWRAGGKVLRLGMPVDPGNLLMLGDLGGVPVLGAPGCARSPRENGFDWLLDRLLADLPVRPDDIAGLGVGGLLMDIVSRPVPRSGTLEQAEPARRRIGAVVLAAGRSSRMEGGNKLLARVAEKPLVVHAVDAALGAGAAPVVVVTGHQAEAVGAVLKGRAVTLVHNPDFAQGLATSLRAGLAALPDDIEAAAILLGDMPHVTFNHVSRLMAAYDPGAGQLIVVPVHGGQRGNPVILSRRFFAELAGETGDSGARGLMRRTPEAVIEVECDGAVLLDLDTPAALDAAGGQL